MTLSETDEDAALHRGMSVMQPSLSRWGYKSIRSAAAFGLQTPKHNIVTGVSTKRMARRKNVYLVYTRQEVNGSKGSLRYGRGVQRMPTTVRCSSIYTDSKVRLKTCKRVLFTANCSDAVIGGFDLDLPVSNNPIFMAIAKS